MTDRLKQEIPFALSTELRGDKQEKFQKEFGGPIPASTAIMASLGESEPG